MNSLLRSRAFVWLWLGGTLAFAADLTLFSNLALWIATDLARHVAWVTIAAGGVTIAAALPMIVFGPLAGVFVDRWPKRRMLLWTDAGRLVSIALLALSARFNHLISLQQQLIALYLLVMLASSCAQFFNPARFVLFSQIVDDSRQAQATAVSQTTNNLVLFLIPALTPLLYVQLGPSWSLGLTTALYALSYSTLWGMQIIERPRPAADTPPFLDELRDGARYLFSQSILRTLFVSSMFQLFGGGLVNALNLFFLLNVLHAPLAFYGLTATTTAIGALIGSSLAVLFIRRLNLIHIYIVGLMATSSGLLIYSRMTNFTLVLVLTGAFGIFQGIVSVPLGPLIMRQTPEYLLGRIIALLAPWQTIFLSLGTATAGILTTIFREFHMDLGPLHFGPIDSVITLGALLNFIGALYAFFNLRQAPSRDQSR